MSLESLCSIHTVSVLERQDATGSSMADSHTFAPTGRTITCRVVPLSYRQRQQLMQENAIQASHRLRTTTNPGVLTGEKHRVKFGNTVMRVAGAPYDAHNLGREWQVMLEALTVDNPDVLDPMGK